MSRYSLTEEFSRILGQPITERGQNTMVLCPWHPDRVPSLSIDLERGLWVDFGGCGKGNIYQLATRLGEPIDETDIILRTYRHVPDSYEPMDFSEMAEEYHDNAKRDKPLEIVKYIHDRGLSPNIFNHFQIGWTGTAISLPYRDDGGVVAMKYRAPNGFKWYESGSRPGLYGISEARNAETVILAEGESDTHAIWSALDRPTGEWHNTAVTGVPGVGKGQPSKATWELWSLDLFWAKRIFVAFDADEAGDAGSVLPLSIFGDKAVRARPPYGKDASDYLSNGGTLDGFLENQNG